MTTTDTLVLHFSPSTEPREATAKERALLEEYVAATGVSVEHAAENFMDVIDWLQTQTIECPVEGCIGNREDHEDTHFEGDLLAVHHEFPPLSEDSHISIYRKNLGRYEMSYELSAGIRTAAPGTSADARLDAARLTAEAQRVDMLNGGISYTAATSMARVWLDGALAALEQAPEVTS